MSDDTPQRRRSEVPTAGVGYGAALAAAKAAIQAARSRAVLAANSELIGLYWQLGDLILHRQQFDGWGTKVVERFSADLRAAFPEMKERSGFYQMRGSPTVLGAG